MFTQMYTLKLLQHYRVKVYNYVGLYLKIRVGHQLIHERCVKSECQTDV